MPVTFAVNCNVPLVMMVAVEPEEMPGALTTIPMVVELPPHAASTLETSSSTPIFQNVVPPLAAVFTLLISSSLFRLFLRAARISPPGRDIRSERAAHSKAEGALRLEQGWRNG